jgi:uncharacterized peroxidase-related enzyme
VAEDWRQADLGTADRALCEYAEKLTKTPAAVSEADVEQLRSAGFDERAILDACNVVCYFNFVTRLAHGLGVDVEEFWTEDEIL